jgi:putative phosphoesterase
MKRILVLADTHGAIAAIDRVLLQNNSVDTVIHLGDYTRDADYIRSKGREVHSVKGNCDFGADVETEMVLHMEGQKILLTHGHGYGVKYSLQRLLYRALELEANAVFYGHTHTPMNGYEQGVLLLNPGSVSEPRGKKPTYALVEVNNGSFRADLKLL